MEIKSWDDVFKQVSKECKDDEELPNWNPEDVRFLHMHLWETLLYYLRHPLECKSGILINEFFKFTFKEKYLHRAIESEHTAQHKYELYKQIIEKINGKRQTKQQKKSE